MAGNIREYDITVAFRRIENELIQSMIHNMQRHKAEEEKEGILWTQWQVEQLKAMEEYKINNQKKYSKQFRKLNKMAESLIKTANESGSMEQEVEILEAIKNGFKGYRQASKTMQAEFFKLNDRKLEALIKATTDDMKKAETAILRMANDQYRSVIFNAQVYANTGAGTYEKAVDMATKDMLTAGLNCVEYSNGARHTLPDYIDMAIRTASKRAYLQGEGTKRQEWGISLVILNKRGNPCPKCLPFCGKVLIDDVWSGGKPEDGEYPLMSYAIAKGLYHPRCKDSHTTYFKGISTADGTWTKEEIRNIGLNAKKEDKVQYAKRQKERFDRLSKYALDKDNQRIYSSKKEEWENKAKFYAETSEKGISENQVERIGSSEVDFSYIYSDAYKDKFKRISQNNDLNKAIYEKSLLLLRDNNGTDTEGLYILKATDGKTILNKRGKENGLGVELAPKDVEIVKTYKNIVGVHNHPTNLLPNGSDFVAAGYRKYDFGIIITHSGKIYKYSVGKKPFTVGALDARIDKYRRTEYNLSIDEAYKKALDEMRKEYGIKWHEVE